MTDGHGHGIQGKRDRFMEKFNSFTNKNSQQQSSSSTNSTLGAGASSTTMNSSSGSGGFPSFRFSPDSEELEEIASNLSVSDEGQADSLPESPRFSTASSGSGGGGGGDTSPIKEYIRKNWASKWDKRSMSLDLDLKGKIITAIEDKKKSVLSHFIPEETSGIAIPTSSSSSSIPEHTGITVAIGEDQSLSSLSSDNLPTHSNSESVSSSRTSLLTEVDSKQQQQQRGSLNHGNSKISFDNTSKQVHLSSEIGDNLSVSSAEEHYEEIGLDYLENMATAGQIDGSVLDKLFPITIKSHQLQDPPLGVPSLGEIPPPVALPSSETIVPVESQDDLQISSIFRDMLFSLLFNKWTLWTLIPLLGAGYYFTIPTTFIKFYWFLVGVIGYHVVNTSLFFEPDSTVVSEDRHRDPVKMTIGTSFTDLVGLVGAIHKYPRSQGWMTELEGDYDPFTYHVRQTRAVFVRIEGPCLYISYPHSRNRISKRRLWSDPPLTSDVTFSKHLVYHLEGSHIFIAPDKLARKRVWNKKYPIGIQLGQFCIVSTIKPVAAGAGGTDSSNNGPPPKQQQPTTSTTIQQNISEEEKPLNPQDTPTSLTTEANSSNSESNNRYRKGDKEVFIRDDCGGKILYLFARTDREKDDWYRRLICAAKEERPIQIEKGKSELSNYVLQKLYMECMKKLIPTTPKDKKGSPHREAVSLNEKPAVTTTTSSDKEPTPPTNRKAADKEKETPKMNQLKREGTKDADDFFTSSKSSSPTSSEDTPTDNLDFEKLLTVSQNPAFLNAFIGRIFFDFLRSTHWTHQVQKLIQKKLNYIRRPQFLDALVVRDIDLGKSAPFVQSASLPFLDSQGLWIDLDITYDGNLYITLETKLNLMKLRKGGEMVATSSQAEDDVGGHGHDTSRNDKFFTNGKPNFQDSDADDSGESSDDDDELDPDVFLAQRDITVNDLQQSGSETNVAKPSKGAKFLRMAEKIANSNFVTDVKVVKKVIANVANIPLILSVEVKSCKGTLALNIPPPPTDRLWLGFRGNPDLQVIVKPKVGSHAVSVTHVTEFIRKKLLHEFQRVMVLPNMDDVTIPLMDFKLPTY